MKLFEIDNQIRSIWDRIASNGGELTEQDILELESLEVARDEKVKAYGVIIRETMSDITNVNAEIERLTKIKKTMQNKVDWLTSNLECFMKQNEMNEYKSLEVNISFRKSERLEIDKDMTLPKKWLVIDCKPNKQAIKEFIQGGGKVKGCQIVEKQNIQIK